MVRNKVDREPRYPVQAEEPIDLVVEAGDNRTETVKATLVDLSCGGAKLRVAERFSLDSKLTFRIEAEGLTKSIEVAADICWTRVAVGSEWWLGCAFNPRMPYELIRELAQAGFIERRESERQEIQIDVSASYELGAARIPVQITSLSPGGFCLSSPEAVRPGSRVLLRIEPDNDQARDGQLISAKSRWLVEAGQGYVVGCEFADAGSHAALRRLSDTDTDSNGSSSFWKRLLRI